MSLWRGLLRLLKWFCRPFSDSFRIVEFLAILIAFIVFFQETANRQEERQARAWQLVTTKAAGNSGKIWALQYLNRERRMPLLPKWWPWNKNRISLRGVDLTPSDLSLGEGKRLPKNDCHQRTYLLRVQLRHADLESAILVCSDLHHADLRGAYLVRADLREANLATADLRAVRMDPSYLDRYFDPTIDQLRADLRKANLTGADLREANLTAAQGNRILTMSAAGSLQAL